MQSFLCRDLGPQAPCPSPTNRTGVIHPVCKCGQSILRLTPVDLLSIGRPPREQSSTPSARTLRGLADASHVWVRHACMQQDRGDQEEIGVKQFGGRSLFGGSRIRTSCTLPNPAGKGASGGRKINAPVIDRDGKGLWLVRNPSVSANQKI
ncbi:hypothetical protein VTG60DRAFT_5907 [Thermothelomyces hinnuleus]